MKLTATVFKATCLAVLDRVHLQRETVTITKRGKVVARLVPAEDPGDRPWLRLRSSRATWHGDPFAPALAESDIEALK